MNEQAILGLISHAVRQILRENGSGWKTEDEIQISQQVADTAWTALIVAAREILSQQGPFVLEGFGCFDTKDGEWQFTPDDSLQEAKALSMPAAAGHQFIARQTLHLLAQARALAQLVPSNTRLDPTLYAAREDSVRMLAEALSPEHTFSEVVAARAYQVAVAVGNKSTLPSFSTSRENLLEGREPDLPEVKVGAIYDGKVLRILDFGAIVQLLPGREGLLHISQISNQHIDAVSDYLHEGQTIPVKVLEADEKGRIRLSMKAAVGEMNRIRPV